MAVLTATLVSVCAGGQHFTLDVTLDGNTKRIAYDRDDLTSGDPASDFTMQLLRIHFKGKNGNQARTELQSGVTITI